MLKLWLDEIKKKPPFATGELPLHELGELGFGDVGVRVSLTEENRQLIAVEIIERNQLWLAERDDAG